MPQSPPAGRSDALPAPAAQPDKVRPEREAPSAQADAALDPMARALCAPHMPAPVPPAAAPPELAPTQTMTVELLIQQLVKKVAWGGDGKRGAARIELGAGVLSGATITLVSNPEGLVVDLDLPSGQSVEEWRERLARGFAARGLTVSELNVH